MRIIVLIVIALSGCGMPEDEVADCRMPVEGVAKGKTTDGLIVHLKPSKTIYLIGEPVTFTVILTNDTQQDIKAWVSSLTEDLEVFLSKGKGFERYEDRTRTVDKVIPSTEPLAPGKAKSYQFRMLYSIWKKDQKESELAFPLAGTYCIKAKYPLFPDRKMFESNVAHITIEKPTGDDAKVWQKINEPTVLKFLHSGHLGTDEEDIPVELAELIEQFPKSGYAESLKVALRPVYDRLKGRMTAEELKSDPWMQKLRKLLDIELKEAPGLFPEDKRLDVKIQYHYPDPTPLADVYNDLSKQSGVTIQLDKALTIRTKKSLQRTLPLRQFMVEQASYKAKWMKEGDGYKLVPDPENTGLPNKE